MFRVFIAEDEMASMNYIKNIISAKCPEFSVVGEAYNGADALEKLQTQVVDVLISDIHMNNVSGIELVGKVKELYPQIQSIIISGYSDFEYAQGAIRASVSDYIMKPIDVAQLVKRMKIIAEKLQQEYFKIQLDIWHKLINKNTIEKEMADYYLPANLFGQALIRRGSLANRTTEMLGQEVVYTELCTTQWILSGRDANELLVIWKEESTHIEEIEKLTARYSEGLCSTVVYAEPPIKLENIYDTIKNLANSMDINITIGVTQTIKLGSTSKQEKMLDHKKFLRSTDFHLQNGNITGLKNELVNHFNEWEKNRYGALQVEQALTQFFAKVLSYGKGDFFDYTKPLTDALLYANSMGELLAEVWNIIVKMLDLPPSTRQSTSDIFALIDEYVMEYYMESLSLQKVCSRFNISQPHLSKLFRKHKNMTFTDYLTMLRMEEAKKLIDENGNIKLKDVAHLVGYSDSLYFSKVFKVYTGCTPSQYGKV